ncbi:MAG: PTS sugar transporter subunit IIA [Phycisphaerales bacterium]|nr:PTS sugar transporter subunit IIA [Phycisphaerales bacterium]
MNIADLISADTIKAPLEAEDRQGVINELVDLVTSVHVSLDGEAIKAAVWEREQQRSTGIGEGLAIPHGRIAGIDRLFMAIGRPIKPVDFEAPDQHPVELVILLLSPPDNTHDHIQALGKISRKMSDSVFRNRAYTAQDSDELHALFSEPANC